MYKRIDDAYIRGCMKEYICDTDADFGNLPDACVGSTAVSIESGKVYIVNTSGKWQEFGAPYVDTESGLWVDGVRTKSWDELVADGTITVEDGVLSQGENGEQLKGDLIPPNDGTITTVGYMSGIPLTSIVIPDSVTLIDDLTGCAELTSITFGENSQLTTIAYSGLSDLPALTSIKIPQSVTDIGDSAFDCCTSLTNITFKGTVAEWNAITKGEDWNNEVPATEVICTDGTVTL